MPVPTGIHSYPNRYAGPCVECDAHVPEWHGQIARTSPRIQNNGRHAFEVRCIGCGGPPTTDRRRVIDGLTTFTEHARPNWMDVVNDHVGADTPEQLPCIAVNCTTSRAIGCGEYCRTHMLENRAAEQAARQAAERERCQTSWDLHDLPRPSRDQLHVFGVRDGTVAFRIWMQENGNMRVYGGTNVTRAGYRNQRVRRHMFQDLVAVQAANSETMRYANDVMRERYADALTMVMDNPHAAIERWGLVIGHCGHCGRTLTNPESVARGIGPICYGRMLAQRWYSENPGRRQCIAPRCSEEALEGQPRCGAHAALAERIASRTPRSEPTYICIYGGCANRVNTVSGRCPEHQLGTINDEAERQAELRRQGRVGNRVIEREPVVAMQGTLRLDELGGGEIL